ncbi:MAG: hypothetical protein WDZ38_00590 [Balneolaceae bacterium]
MSLDINELIKKAAKAAENAPEHLQEAAFNKAFELLSSDNLDDKPSKSGTTTKAKKKKSSKTSESENLSIDELDRTAHPEINHHRSSLENSLYLLQAAKQDLGIDGLNAATIARILVDKFRCDITRQAISLALNDAGRYVNKVKQGRSVIFKIMAPGEDYINSIGDTSTYQKKASSPKKRKSNSTQTKKKKLKNSNSSKSSRVGPTTAMSKLFDDGFFKSGKTISEIIEKLKHDRGRTFKSNELSPGLLRWLRNGKLTREKNSDNQYEYKEA